MSSDPDDGCYEYFTADWRDSDPPAEINIYVDGSQDEMHMTWGEDPANAIYTAELPSRDFGFGCHEYFVQYATADGRIGTFPEEGSYLYGDDCDVPEMWVSTQAGWTPDLEERSDAELREDVSVSGGCASAPSRAWLGLAIAGALTAVMRRRSLR